MRTLLSLLHLRGRFILFYLPRGPPIGHFVLLLSGSGAGDSCGIEPVWGFSLLLFSSFSEPWADEDGSACSCFLSHAAKTTAAVTFTRCLRDLMH